MQQLVLKASGFDPEYFDVDTKLEHLKYKLSIGNTCLVLPKTISLTDCAGVYVSVRWFADKNSRVTEEFWVRKGFSSERMPYIYRNNYTLWVPLAFITIAADCCTDQEEETTMDLVSLVMAEDLYAVEVEFSKGGQRYTYKSQTEIAAGSKVVVDSPTSGFVVVTVVSCSKGLDTAIDKFPAYKWVVDVVDVEEYDRLRNVEKSMVEKAKAKQRLDAARKQLEELGFTQDELIAMVKGNA